MESEKVVGKAEAVSEERGGIMIGQKWFNAEPNCKAFVKAALKGRDVELTITSGNSFGFIKDVGGNVQAAPAARPPTITPWGEKDRQIVRQTCIKAAAEIVAAGVNPNAATKATTQEIIVASQIIAAAFEEWVMRK